jgi:hypothetical protein
MVNNNRLTNDGNVATMDQQQHIHQMLFASMNLKALIVVQ